MGKSGPIATFNLFFIGLGWPWVGEFVGFIIIFTCFPTQHNFGKSQNTVLDNDLILVVTTAGAHSRRRTFDICNRPSTCVHWLVDGVTYAGRFRQFKRSRISYMCTSHLSVGKNQQVAHIHSSRYPGLSIPHGKPKKALLFNTSPLCIKYVFHSNSK